MLLRLILLLLLFAPTHALAVSVITINASSAPYSTVPTASGVGVRDELAVRQAAMVALVGMYRTTHPNDTVETGQIFEFKWADGSKERGKFITPFSHVGVVPIEGTQSMPSSGGIGYTTYPNGNYYGGPNVTGVRAITQTTTVCGGGYCESVTNVIGYEWIYGPGGRPGNEVV